MNKISIDNRKSKIIYGILTILITFIITVSYFGLWGTDINVPISAYRGDSVGVLLEAANYARGGNVHEKACMGAPDIGGYWYNIGDSSVPIPFIYLLSKLFGSIEAAINIHAVMNYILMAISMFWVCTKLGAGNLISMISGICYSSLTYFVFFANTFLLIYGACFYIPLFCFILIEIMQKEKKMQVKEFVFLVAVMFYVGINSAYYAFFCMIILAFVGLYALLGLKSVEKVLTVAVCYLAIGVGIVLYTIPNILHSAFHFDALWNSGFYGVFCLFFCAIVIGLGILFYKKIYPHISIKSIWIFIAAVAFFCGVALLLVSRFTNFLGEYEGRSVFQTQEMTFSVVNAFLPAVNSVFGNVNEQLRLLVDLENCDFTVLGPLTGIGLIASVLFMFRYENNVKTKNEILGICGKCNCFAIVVAVKGGLSLLIASYITTGIRYYSRMCIFIACFSLIAFALIIDQFAKKIKEVRVSAIKYLLEICMCIIIIAGMLLSIPTDFIYNNTYGNHYGLAAYDQRKKEYDDWQELIRKIEMQMEEGDMILELPIETDIIYAAELMIHGREYELSIPAIVSEKTTWSYSGEFKEPDSVDNIENLLIKAAAYDFKGIYVDTLLYPDDSYQAVLEELEKYLGEPVVCNENRRFFYNMTSFTSNIQSKYSEEELKKIKQSTKWGE